MMGWVALSPPSCFPGGSSMPHSGSLPSLACSYVLASLHPQRLEWWVLALALGGAAQGDLRGLRVHAPLDVLFATCMLDFNSL